MKVDGFFFLYLYNFWRIHAKARGNDSDLKKQNKINY